MSQHSFNISNHSFEFLDNHKVVVSDASGTHIFEHSIRPLEDGTLQSVVLQLLNDIVTIHTNTTLDMDGVITFAFEQGLRCTESRFEHNNNPLGPTVIFIGTDDARISHSFDIGLGQLELFISQGEILATRRLNSMPEADMYNAVGTTQVCY